MKDFNFLVHTDSSTAKYDLKVFSDGEEYIYPIYRNASRPVYSGKTGRTVSLSMSKLPEYVVFEWRNQEKGVLKKNTMDLTGLFPEDFFGGILFSILEDDTLELSWKLRGGKNNRYIDCGGYIFEKYYYRARPKIEKSIARWKRYLKQKEQDLNAGLAEKYKNPKHYDLVTEADFRCNDLFYLKP